MEVSQPLRRGVIPRAEILLVEDHPGDVRLAREALLEAKIDNQLHVVTDGTQALAFLRREGRFASAVRPDLVLLDLNLPRRSGREVLEEMKADAELAPIPVVVVTSSQAEVDALRSLQLGAAGFMQKPIDFRQLASIVRSVAELGIAIVRVDGPPRRNTVASAPRPAAS